MTTGVWQTPNIDRNARVWVSPWGWKAIMPCYLMLGQNTDIADGVTLLCQLGIEVGDNVQIGPGARILSVDTISGKQGKVTIEKDARVGANAVIMPGVTIGAGAIVGAGSVLTTNVPPGEIWHNASPAKFQRKR